MRDNKSAWWVVIVAVITAVAVGVSQQNPPQEPQVPVGTTSTTAAPSTTAPPLESRGVWRSPADDASVDPRSHEWVARLLRYGAARPETFGGIEFGGEQGNSYGVPTYDAQDATMRVKVRRKANWPGIFNISPDETVPWNPAWRPASGRDAFMHVIDSETGHAWGYWNVSWWSYPIFGQHQEYADNNNNQCHLNPENAGEIWFLGRKYGGVGYDAGSMLCAASAFQVRDPDGKPVDIRTWPGNFPGASGGGWWVMAVTPDEVASGDIGHALHMLIKNTMGGPLCTAEQRLQVGALGNLCGDAVSPAGQMESGAAPGHLPLAQSVPEGMRFKLTITDEEAEAFVDSKGYKGAKRQTALTFIRALRDYGWFIGDTTNDGAMFTAASVENPSDRAKWKELGIDHTDADGLDRNLLYGLFTEENVVALAPSTSLCADGTTSRWYCRAVSTGY